VNVGKNRLHLVDIMLHDFGEPRQQSAQQLSFTSQCSLLCRQSVGQPLRLDDGMLIVVGTHLQP